MKQNIFKRSMAVLLGLTLTIPQMFSPVMADDIPEEPSESAAVEETKETGAFYLGLNEGGTVTFDLQDGSKIQFSKQSDGTVLRTKGKKMKILEPNADTVLAYEGTVGEEVSVSVQPDETHEANNMSVWVNEQKREIGENPTTLKVEQNDQILLVSFTEKQEEQEEESSENSEEESEDEDDSEPPQTDEEKDESDPVEETSESNSSEESSTELDEPADPFEKVAEDSILTKTELKKIDFSSKRLLVAGDENLILDPEHILSSYDGVYLLQYDDEKTARNAFSYYYGKAAFVDVDGVVSTASGESGAVGSSEMTEDENPIAELESAVDENPGNVKGTVIALIDTGVNDMTGVLEAVSMIGDDPSDSNGHGTAMAGYIHSVNPDAKILSIKALGADGTGDASAVYAAIEYAISRKASIINLSITAARKLENAAVVSAIEKAQASGIQVVGAAGNKAKKADYYVPGCVTGAYIIGACDEHGEKIPSSNYGDTVDFNVVAESTSEAAAKFSGYLSMGKNEADEVLVFPTSYKYKEPEPEEPEDPEPGEEETEETVSLKIQIRHGGHAFITYDDKKAELWKDQDGTMHYEGELSFETDESDLFFTGMYPKNAQVSLDVTPNSDYEMTLYRINDQPASGGHQDLALSSDTEVNIGFSPAEDGRFVIAANPEPDVADGYETTGSYEILWTNNMTGSGTMADQFELELTSGTLEGYVGYFDCVSPGVASGRVGFTGSYYAKATVTESDYTKTTSWYIYAYGPYGFNLYTQMNETHQDMLGDYSYSKTVEPKKGGIEIQKNDEDMDAETAQGAASLKGIKFAVVNKTGDVADVGGTDYADGKVIRILTTDANGHAATSNKLLPEGKYAVYELRSDATIEVGDTYEGSKKLGSSDMANTYYRFGSNSKTVTVKADSLVKATFENPILRGGLKVIKKDAETKNGDPQGNASIKGIRFAVVNSTGGTVKVGSTIFADGKVVRIITANADGEAATSATLLPYGAYYVYELRQDATIEAGDTYEGSKKLGSSDMANDDYEFKANSKKFTVNSQGELKEVSFTNKPKRGGITIQKKINGLKDGAAQADGSLKGIRFAVVNNSTNPVVISDTEYAKGKVVSIITTNKDGLAKTSATLLPKGSYEVYELRQDATIEVGDTYEGSKKLGSSDLANDTVVFKDNHATVKVTPGSTTDAPDAVFDNDEVSGKAKVSKTNPDTGTAVEGDASPEGIKVAVINSSAEAVAYDGKEISKGEVVTILSLNAKGEATTEDLPYGKYTLYELRADATIKVGETYSGSEKLGSSSLANDQGYLYKAQHESIEIHKDGEVKAVAFEDPIIHGDVKIEKWDKDLGRKAAQGDADFSGIQFEIKNASKNAVVVSGKSYAVGEVVMTLTTDAKGDAATTGKLLPYGTYTIQEVKTNDKYLLTDGTLRTFVIRNEAETVTTSTDKNSLHFDNVAVKGSISIQKDDKERASGETQGDADLSGIRFAIVNESEKLVKVNGKEYEPGKVVTIITTNAKGKASTAKDLLPYGTYHVYELRQDAAIEAGDTYEGSDKLGSSIYANASYLFAANEQKVEVRENSKMYPVSFTNEVVHGGVKIGKIDRETDTNVPQGLATLKDAEFTIYNNSERPVMVGKVEYKVGEKIRSFTSDEEGLFETAADLLPYGTYVVKETKPPVGYLPNTTWQVTFQIREEGVIVDTTTEEGKTEDPDKSGWLEVKGGSVTNPAEVPDDIIRGDVTFKKVDIDGYPMPGIPFVIQRLDTEGNVVESHVIVSDENGLVSTKDRKKTDEKVNSLDQYMKDGVFTEDSMLDGTAGVWFGEQSARDESRGALIYANYMIKELRCKANEGQDLLKTDEPVEIRENNREVSLSNTLVDLNIRLESEAMDVTSDSKVVTYGTNVELSDTVSYIHLKVYNEYELITSFYNIRKDGKNVKLGEGSITFTPEQTDNTKTAYGEVTNTVTVDTTKAEPGSEIVAVDQLYKYEDGKKTFIASHNMDCAVESQKLFVPEMKTEASDSKTKDHVGTAEVEASIADILKYKNLADQKIYLVTAKLRDAETGEEVAEPVTRLLRINYKDTEVSQKMLYWQGPKDGTLIMPTFVFDASAMEGKTLVVTETLTDMDSGEVILTHEALDDTDQQIHYIRVRTEAKDGITESHVGTVTEKATVIDQVTIENAVIGETYVITGSLVYQEDCMDADGVSHKAGDIIAEHEPVEVVAEDTTIVKDLVFTLDASKLEGISGTAFEDVYHKNILVGTHHDIHSEPQTVYWPKVRTTATDGETKTHTGLVGEKATIIDEVKLTNLVVGETYTVRGTLKTSEGDDFLVENNPLIVSQELTATAKEMTIPMEFTFNSSELNGRSLVVFEELFHGDVEVARHEDKNDKGQTISYPDAKTNAADSSTKDQVGMVTQTDTIIDTVSYHNLVVGETYTIKGQLIYKEPFVDVNHLVHKAGDPVLDKKGNPITAETTFEAKEQEGTVDLVYTLESSLLKGSTVIVFEDIFSNGVKVFSHADLEDEDQSVWYPSVRTMAIDTVTEDHVGTNGHEAVIRDTVELKNLKVGETYKVYGTLMDKDTGEAVVDANGANITAESDEFIAESRDMTITMEFTLDASIRENMTTVVFEELIHKDVVVAAHAEISDEGQSIHHPAVHTTATDEETGEHVGRAREKTVIHDTVKLYNLIPGMTYELEGYLVDSDSGKPYLDADGNEVRVHTEPFAVERGKEDTEMILTFTFNGSNLEGKSVTVFEDLYHSGHIVAAHRLKSDEDQMVNYPEIHTTATDKKTGDHISKAGEKVTIIDEVTYTNLRPGLTYKVKGVLMNKQTGKALKVNGEKITAEKEFTPKKKDGSVKLEFTFDASALAGETVVVFEDVYYNEIEVAVHHDIEDEDQTVVIPSVRTTVVDKADGDRKVKPDSQVTLVDTVYLSGLLAGRQYRVYGQVMNKKTGEVLMDGKNQVEAMSDVFTADGPEMEIDVAFDFTIHGIEDTDLVIFEKLMMLDNENNKETEVGSHEDWDDKDQTVYVEKSPRPHNPKTGDTTRVYIPLLMMVVSLAGIISLVVFKRKLR